MSQIAIGVDVGGSKIHVVALDRRTQILAEERLETPPLGRDDSVLNGPASLTSAVVLLVARLRSHDEVRQRRWEVATSSIGIGLAGLVDRRGVLRSSPHLPLASGLTPQMLEAALGQRVVLENDATCATLAEHRRGALQGVGDALMVTLGTGIGAGVVLTGRLRTGAHGFIGELGHIVLDPNGPSCACGRRGCFEAYASGQGLGRLGSEDLSNPLSAESITNAARSGDPTAISVIERWAALMAIGLCDAVALLDPSRICIGGGVSDSSDVLWPSLESAFRRQMTAHRPTNEVELVLASFGSRAGAVGAALLGRHGI